MNSDNWSRNACAESEAALHFEYEYLVFPVEDVAGCLAWIDRKQMPDAFLSSDPMSAALAKVRHAGFRWIRTDGEHAIFERKYLTPREP